MEEKLLIGCLEGQHLVDVNTNVCVSVYLCVQENQKNKTKPKTMLRENSTKQKKWWGAKLEVLGEESIEWWQWYLVKTH